MQIRCVMVSLVVAFSAVLSFAQDAPPAPDQSAAQQELRQTIGTIVENMRAKGIDPRDIFQQIQNGADPSEISQQLVDKGVVDQQTLTNLQGKMQALTTGRIKDELQATDEEWAVIQPRLQKVMSTTVERSANRGMAGFANAPSGAAADLAKASRELRAALKDADTKPDKFVDLLASYRTLRDKARDEHAAACKDLASVLTTHQEGVLVSLGILQ